MKFLNLVKLLPIAIAVLAATLVSPMASGPQDADPNPAYGQSVTLLPNGNWLLLGGLDEDGNALASASIYDSNKNLLENLKAQMTTPRTWHTATLLPDGTVLILGGISQDGNVISVPEIFDASTNSFSPLAVPHSNFPSSRAHHTSTLLTEGHVLIAGGLSGSGKTLNKADLWDPRTGTSESLADEMSTARIGHSATLFEDGRVLLWGGEDGNRNGLDDGEFFDPATRTFSPVEIVMFPSNDGAPVLSGSEPLDDEADIPVDSIIAVRFSEPLDVRTVNSETVTLSGPNGVVDIHVVPTEGGMLVFVTPENTFAIGSRYMLTLDGPVDPSGFSLPETSITFTTVDEYGPLDEEDWIPDEKALGGDWRIRKKDSPWRALPPLEAEAGITALAGQVLTLNGQPLANTTLKIENTQTYTDATGRFLLQNIPAGHHVLVVDGQTSNQVPKRYGVFEVGVDVSEGWTNILSYTIWMPKIDWRNSVAITSPTTEEIVVTTPRIPGLEVRIPPDTIIRDLEGNPVNRISITPIPVDRPPFPLPKHVYVPIYFTIQPGGANIETLTGDIPHGARIIYPNYLGLAPGKRGDFWNYEPSDKGWYVYGQGHVTVDGSQVVPDLGVAVYKFTGAMFTPPPHLGGDSGPETGPPPGAPDETGGPSADGDPVDLATGLFVLSKTDLLLIDTIPITITRTYRPNDSTSRTFGIGTTNPYDIFLEGDNSAYSYADLILPHGGRVHYVRTSSGTGYEDAVFEHTSTPSRFHGSILTWNGNGWDLTFKDGLKYILGDAAPLQGIMDRYGNRITILRSSGQTGNISSISSDNGRAVNFTYDTANRITEIKDNLDRTVTYEYDGSGRLWKVTDPEGGITEYIYDANHRMLTIRDALGIVFLANEYDANGRVIGQTQADSTTYAFSYTLDGNGKVTQTDVTDPRGFVRRVTFNADSYALTDARALGETEEQTITYEREAGTNLVLSMTDNLGRKTAYTYDSIGNVESITRLSGTAELVTTTMTYETAFNQVETITDPLGNTTTFTYDSGGNLTTVTDPLGNNTTLSYDTAGQPVSIIDPLSNTTQFTYDMGDLAAVADPLGNITTRFTDAAGRLLSLTNPLGNTTRYDYDDLNRLLDVTDPLQGITAFSYDPNGNLLGVTDTNGNATGYTYDSMDRLAARTDPLSLAEPYDYDGNGNLAQFTDRKGQVTDFTYDALNRRTLATYSDDSTTAYTYDAADRLTQVVDSVTGTITLTYDDLDRLISETTPQGAVGYAYDDAGRRTSMTVAGQPTVNYAYDDANRLTQITQGSSVVTIGYDTAGRRTSLTMPNGVVVDYNYDAASRVTEIKYKQGTTELGNLTYVYDAAGNRTETGGTWARSGIPQELTSAAYNAANQMIAFGTKTLTYDANGNLTSDGTNTYTWDARNRLAGISGGVAASFEYDPLGRRVNKTINGTSTDFLYDGINPVQELSGGNPTANVLAGLGIDEFFTRTDSLGTETLLTDILGSTVATTDFSGSVLTEYTYEPFGDTTTTGGVSDNSFQYTGRENDGTGLFYYRARYYSPTLHRFTADDPLDLSEIILMRQNAPDEETLRLLGLTVRLNPQLLHPSQYVLNNPINYTDPSGEFVPQIIGCAVGAGISIGMDSLAGRKIDWIDAGIGCGLGAVGAWPIGKGFKFAIHGPHHYFPSLGKKLTHLQVNWWQKGVKGSGNQIRIPFPRNWWN